MITDKSASVGDPRMRRNNSNDKAIDSRQASATSELLQPSMSHEPAKAMSTMEHTRLVEQELKGFLPIDSMQLLKQLLAERLQKNKVFGRDIFNNKLLTFEPNMNVATPQNYRLGPGDDVIIDIYGASQRTINGTISPDGDVTIEGFGPVQLSGLTVAQANARLRSTLGARYSSSKLRLTVGQTKTITVNVMGEVQTPGTYALSAFATVFQALYMAGGTNNVGTLRNIKIYRDNRLVSMVDIYDYILNGKMSGNVRLASGDVIIVGPYDSMVSIEGKVKRPMFYEMKKDETIASLLKYAGGFTGSAYRKSVRSEEHTSELQSRQYLVCRLLLEKKKNGCTPHLSVLTSNVQIS